MQFKAHAFSTETVAAVLEALPETTVGRRNRALVELLVATGLRVNEALGLETGDIDLGIGFVTVRHPKGCPCHTEACQELRREAAKSTGLPRACSCSIPTRCPKERHAAVVTDCPNLEALLAERETGLVFVNAKGERVRENYVRAMFGRVSKVVGERIHAHGFRHTHAVRLVRKGSDLMDARDQLGHTSIETTSKYLREIDPMSRIERLRAA